MILNPFRLGPTFTEIMSQSNVGFNRKFLNLQQDNKKNGKEGNFVLAVCHVYETRDSKADPL
jgi:hypothetical protein